MTKERSEQLVSENKRLKDMLENERKRFITVMNSIVDGVYMTDIDRLITFWNSGAERITGFRAGDVTGTGCRSLLGHVDESGNSLCDISCPLSATMDSNTPVYGKNVYTCTSSGAMLPVSVSCAPLIGPDGGVVGAVEVFRDITEQKKLERQKADFYSMITHDIKTPLTIIMGYSELMMDKGDGLTAEDVREYARGITSSASNIKGLVEDFLSVSKLSTGAVELEKEPMILEDLLKKLLRDLSAHAAAKDITLSYTAEPSLPVIHADHKMMDRALSNLISNSIKYTPEGGSVTVTVHRLGEEQVGITVTDTGRGIPEEDRGRVFDMYYRSSNNHGVEGTGVGLAIVKAICEAHGGTVKLDSTIGKGSTFTIQLPVMPVNP